MRFLTRRRVAIYFFFAFVVFLLFFRLTRADFLGDDAHYAFRAIGYYDYMNSENQTTPVQWFGTRPFWSLLSFHDHPPLFFLVQFFFFKAFGVSAFIARLPTALAVVGTALVAFFMAKKLLGSQAAVLTLAALAVNSYFIWTGRVGYLEGLFSFFLFLGLFFTIRAFEREAPRADVRGIFNPPSSARGGLRLGLSASSLSAPAWRQAGNPRFDRAHRRSPKPDDVFPSRASSVPPFIHSDGRRSGLRAEADKNWDFIFAGIFFGLAFLSKYTLLFALPGLVLYLLLKQRWVFRERHFWLGVVIFLVISLPVVFYNYQMYQQRGHFDVQFSDLFRQDRSDWSILDARLSNFHFQPQAVIATLIKGQSLLYSLVFFCALALVILRRWRSDDRGVFLIVFTFFSLFLGFSVVGGSAHWLGVLTPFTALIIGLAGSAVDFNKYLLILGPLLALFFLTFTFYTNHAREVSRIPGYFYSPFRLENYGYNQLDQEVSRLLSDKRSSQEVQETMRRYWYGKLNSQEINFSSIDSGSVTFPAFLVYDVNMSWFPVTWVFDRWKFYRRLMIFSTYEFLRVLDEPEARQSLDAMGFERGYFIFAADHIVTAAQTDYPQTKEIKRRYPFATLKPRIVYDDKGREAFYIYELNAER
ncbi:MAG: glycosyltransferase family 39 protein [Candidatus Doudnabacteria bacterium]|nr:glycosyltransferase family 39 protein [Candidatus Doudnabacteria bacterium]